MVKVGPKDWRETSLFGAFPSAFAAYLTVLPARVPIVALR